MSLHFKMGKWWLKLTTLLRVLPNKSKIDKKRSRSQRDASSFFRKCPYTYCACYKRLIMVASVKHILNSNISLSNCTSIFTWCDTIS